MLSKMEGVADNPEQVAESVAFATRFETHKRLWKERREERQDPQHPEYGKPVPMMIPPSHARLFQITLAQTHSTKFQQHFWCCKH